MKKEMFIYVCLYIFLKKKKYKSLKMSNKCILQNPNRTQFIITLPKSLVLAKGWKKGCVLEFMIDNKGDIIIKCKK